jgi:hypothetical protein
MAFLTKELSSPPIAEDTLEQASSRLHSLLESFLEVSSGRKEVAQGFRPTGSPAQAVDANELGMREALAETCRRVEALVANPREEMMTLSYAVRIRCLSKARVGLLLTKE